MWSIVKKLGARYPNKVKRWHTERTHVLVWIRQTKLQKMSRQTRCEILYMQKNSSSFVVVSRQIRSQICLGSCMWFCHTYFTIQSTWSSFCTLKNGVYAIDGVCKISSANLKEPKHTIWQLWLWKRCFHQYISTQIKRNEKIYTAGRFNTSNIKICCIQNLVNGEWNQ